MNDSHLKKFGIYYLHYMTHIDNVVSILEKGILSYNLVSQMHIEHRDIADQGVQQNRNKKVPLTQLSIHEYVPLYFATQTPMQYVITQSAATKGRSIVCSTKDLIFLDLDASQIFGQPGVIFSDGNAARASETKFYADPADLVKLDWETINCPGDYYGSSGKCYNPEWKRKKSSEVLVPGKVSPQYISRIVVFDENASKKLANKIQTAGKQFDHSIKYDTEIVSKYYF